MTVISVEFTPLRAVHSVACLFRHPVNNSCSAIHAHTHTRSLCILCNPCKKKIYKRKMNGGSKPPY